MTFKAKILSDNTVTPAGKLACKMAWEYYTVSGPFEAPPPATSLDAWRLIWQGMDYSAKKKYLMGLAVAQNPLLDVTEEWFESKVITGALLFNFTFEAEPHHHLEAALRAAEVECDHNNTECEEFEDMTDCPSYCHEECIEKWCTCTNGRITLYDKWKREVE